MTVRNEDLFRAILAMDAYNRGYDAGLKLSNNTAIGDALIGASKGDAEAQAEGFFFAQAYTWDSKTIISYRGTDILPVITVTPYQLHI